MDNGSVNVLGFQFETERDSLQEPFLNEDDDNKTKQKRGSSQVSQPVEEWCKCGKCKAMLSEKEGIYCHEAALHYLYDNIWGGFTNFDLCNKSLKNSRCKRYHKGFCVICDCFWVSTFINSYLEVWVDLICLFKVGIIQICIIKFAVLVSPSCSANQNSLYDLKIV